MLCRTYKYTLQDVSDAVFDVSDAFDDVSDVQADVYLYVRDMDG